MSNIGELVDRLGDIKDRIKELEKQEKELNDKLMELVEVGKTYYGDQYEAKVTEVTKTELDPVAVKKFLKDDNKFMSIVSITKTAAKTVMLEPDIERLSKVTGSQVRITFKRKRNGG